MGGYKMAILETRDLSYSYDGENKAIDNINNTININWLSAGIRLK